MQIEGTFDIIVFQTAQAQTFSLPAAALWLIASIFLSVPLTAAIDAEVAGRKQGMNPPLVIGTIGRTRAGVIAAAGMNSDEGTDRDCLAGPMRDKTKRGRFWLRALHELLEWASVASP